MVSTNWPPLIAAVAGILSTSARPASAQTVRGFAFGGSTSDLNNQQYPALGGGVLVDLGQPWIAVGGQGETFFQLPYFAGRGAVFGQARILPHSVVSPFVLGGVGFGEDAGPVIGGGIEFRAPNSRWGFRLAIEDFVQRPRSYSYYGFQGRSEGGHQVATRFGITF